MKEGRDIVHDTQTRITIAKKRAKYYQRCRTNLRVGQLCGICCILAVLDVCVISSMSGSLVSHQSVNLLAGAMLLYRHAGGYVLVAVCTAVIAVSLTVCCMNKHQKEQERE